MIIDDKIKKAERAELVRMNEELNSLIYKLKHNNAVRGGSVPKVKKKIVKKNNVPKLVIKDK